MVDQRARYWSERFARADTNPEEARALLMLFAELAEHPSPEDGEPVPAGCPAEGADPMLVQWVAQRVRAWATAGFDRDKATHAFGTKKAAHAPSSARTAEKRARALAEVHRLNRLEGMPLTDAFEAAGKHVSLSSAQVRDDYEAFRTKLSNGGEVADWLPMLLRLPRADRERALAKGRVGRPKKTKPAG